MVKAVETCVHCGFCLPTCPTYQVLGEEMDSPRGRIVLMKSVLEGDLAIDEAMPFINRCLGCQACVTACPSGVQYGELLMPFRAHARKQTSLPVFERIRHNLINSTFPDPGRFRKAVSRHQRTSFPQLMPVVFRMIDICRSPVTASPLPEFHRRRVYAGQWHCGWLRTAGIGSEINWATLRVLAVNGVDVIIRPARYAAGVPDTHR
jgi:glycolate oxidase iron-sulfur subunit